MQESQDDAMFNRDIPLAIRESNEIFAKSVQQMNSSILLLAQGMNRSMEMFTRSSFQERPLSHYFMQPAGPTQSQGEFNRIPSQQNYSCDGTDTHSNNMLITVFVAVMRVETKKIILNQIILEPTIIFKGAL